MRPQDRKRFLTAITKTRVTLPGPQLTDEEKAVRTEVFWDELQKYPIEAIERAFKKANGDLNFFPTPAEIISFIFLEKETAPPRVEIEYRPSPEEARRILDNLNTELRKIFPDWDEDTGAQGSAKVVLQRLKGVKPTLEGSNAQRFEEKRVQIRKQAKIINAKA